MSISQAYNWPGGLWIYAYAYSVSIMVLWHDFLHSITHLQYSSSTWFIIRLAIPTKAQDVRRREKIWTYLFIYLFFLFVSLAVFFFIPSAKTSQNGFMHSTDLQTLRKREVWIHKRNGREPWPYRVTIKRFSVEAGWVPSCAIKSRFLSIRMTADESI